MKHPDTGTELKPTVVSKTFVENGVQVNFTDVPATHADGDLFFEDGVVGVFSDVLERIASNAIPGLQRIDISYEKYVNEPRKD